MHDIWKPSRLLLPLLLWGGGDVAWCQEPRQDRVLVRYIPDPLRRYSEEPPVIPVVVKLKANETVAGKLLALNNDTGVAYAEPDYAVRALPIDAMEPNDPSWAEQWGSQAVKAKAAWDMLPASAENVTVCVMDSGIDYEHPNLRDRMHPLIGYNALEEDNDYKKSYNATSGENDPMDDNGHGTHCAGIIGASGNNSLGVAGISPRVLLLACKFMDSTGFGHVEDAIECLNFCQHHNATISSNSYEIVTNGNDSKLFKAAVEQAGGGGHLFIAAAGNGGRDVDDFLWDNIPASFARNLTTMISVAALEQTNDGGMALWKSTNYGRKSTLLAAPGVFILSTWLNQTFSNLNGSSMAAPYVAGAAALLRSATGGKLNNTIIRQILLDTVQANGYPYQKLKVCANRTLDLEAAMKKALAMAAAAAPQQQPPPIRSPPPDIRPTRPADAPGPSGTVVITQALPPPSPAPRKAPAPKPVEPPAPVPSPAAGVSSGCRLQGAGQWPVAVALLCAALLACL